MCENCERLEKALAETESMRRQEKRGHHYCQGLIKQFLKATEEQNLSLMMARVEAEAYLEALGEIQKG